MSIDLSPITRGGLLFKEVAELLQVSRVTVGRWMHEQTEPHSLITEELEELMGRVNEAVKRGDLPLAPTVPREDRLTCIRRRIRKKRKTKK